jgi:predicted CoA-binding protein
MDKSKAKTLLDRIDTVLVIGWPNKEVPELLAQLGFKVVVHRGPGPEDYSVSEVKDGKVVSRHFGLPPEHVKLVYSYRPLSELPQTITTAKQVRAKILWTQSGVSAEGPDDWKGCWLEEKEQRSAAKSCRIGRLDVRH